MVIYTNNKLNNFYLYELREVNLTFKLSSVECIAVTQYTNVKIHFLATVCLTKYIFLVIGKKVIFKVGWEMFGSEQKIRPLFHLHTPMRSILPS
jgi:hypothetical protein